MEGSPVLRKQRRPRLDSPRLHIPAEEARMLLHAYEKSSISSNKSSVLSPGSGRKPTCSVQESGTMLMAVPPSIIPTFMTV